MLNRKNKVFSIFYLILGMTLFIPSSARAVCDVLGSDGLVAHWKLDENSGGTVADSSGNGLTGTLTGDNTAMSFPTNALSSGVVDGAVQFFNASNEQQWIAVSDPGSNSALDFDDGDPITISVWIRPDDVTSTLMSFLHKATTAVNSNYGLQTVNDTVAFYYYGAGWEDFSSGSVLSVDQWTHVAVTYECKSSGYVGHFA